MAGAPFRGTTRPDLFGHVISYQEGEADKKRPEQQAGQYNDRPLPPTPGIGRFLRERRRQERDQIVVLGVKIDARVLENRGRLGVLLARQIEIDLKVRQRSRMRRHVFAVASRDHVRLSRDLRLETGDPRMKDMGLRRVPRRLCALRSQIGLGLRQLQAKRRDEFAEGFG